MKAQASAAYALALALLLGTVVALLLAAPAALAHGEDTDVLAQTPARALVQQALALLTQQGDAVEAHERLEAALESEDTGGIDLKAVRAAAHAFDEGDHSEAEMQMNAALAPAEEPRVKREKPGRRKDGMEMGGNGQAATPEEAFEHAGELEVDRGGEEWIGLAAGAAAILLAGLGLAGAGRRERCGFWGEA